jgi:hypothetical protein
VEAVYVFSKVLKTIHDGVTAGVVRSAATAGKITA